MADYQQKTGQGAAFLKSKTNERQPDYQGEVLSPSGEKMEISIWKKISTTGKEYLSIALKPPFVAGQQQPKDDMPDFMK